MSKKGLAGIYGYQSLWTAGYKDLLGLKDGFVYRNWSSRDPRLDGTQITHRWYPNLWGDSLPITKSWANNIPHDYGREHSSKPRPSGYSFYADDGYNFGDYYEYVAHDGSKRRVRLALFLNEPDATDVLNEQGFAESAGMPAKIAAHFFFYMVSLWPHIHWVAPTLSQQDFFNGNVWLREFVSELNALVKYSLNGHIERAKPFSRWVFTSLQWYPKGFHLIPASKSYMCDISYPISQVHAIYREAGMLAEHRKHIWVTETNSPVAQSGPDFPPPPGDYSDWGPKDTWPGALRWKKWTEDYNSNPWVDYWFGFIGTHIEEEKQKYAFIDRYGILTTNGRTFKDA